MPAPCSSVLLIHGAGGGSWEWNLWRGVMRAQGFPVHVLDLVPASQGLAGTTFDDYLLQVQHAVTQMRPPRFVIGASLGGLLALQVAAGMDGLVLVNPLPPSPWHNQLPARRWDDVVRWRDDSRLLSTQRAMPDCDEASVLFALRHWRNESGAVLRHAYAGIEAGRPGCPVLLMHSAQDQDVPVSAFVAMASAWQADRVETRASSHLGPLLGRHATHAARQAVAWLNQLPSHC